MPELLEFNVKAKRKPIPVAAQLAAGDCLLQHGKRYVTRSGAITGQVDKQSLVGGYAVCKHSETGVTGTWFYTNDGHFAGMQHIPDYGMHIVKEYVETVVQPAPANFLPLQVGKKYLCQNGKTVRITKKAVTNAECVMGVSDENQVLKYEAASGRRFVHKELAVAPWHIVSEVVEKLVYISGQVITKAEANKLFKEVQIQYQKAMGGTWYDFPKNHYKAPSGYIFASWRVK